MTTHATCLKITRRDATVEGYTSHDADLVVSGVTYVRSAGYLPSAIQRSSDMQSDNQSVQGIIDSDNISESDLRAGIYNGARIELLLVDWDALTLVRTLFVGHFGQVQIQDNQYSVSSQSIEHELSKPIGRVGTLRCPWEFGGSKCGYSLSADTGTVTAVTTARRVFTDTSRTEADEYYNGGKLTWTSGDNNGRTMDVKTYDLGTQTIELYEPMPSDISASDTYDIYRGCDKTFETCRDTFSNVNPTSPAYGFGGQPYRPGVSDLVSGQTGTN